MTQTVCLRRNRRNSLTPHKHFIQRLYIQTVFFEQEIEKPNCKNTFFISTGHDVVFNNDNLLERVIYAHQ